MITLAIDTSTSTGSVAVLGDDDLLLDETFLADRSHSASLFSVLERARLVAPHVDRIAIGIGPGSFAGVRIAIAAALGWQLVDGAELVGVPSLAALAGAAREYLAIGDARRDTFYYTRVCDGICLEGPLLLTPEGLRERLDQNPTPLPVYCSLPIASEFGAELLLPSAAIIARLAREDRGISARGVVEPIYLKEPHITYPSARKAL